MRIIKGKELKREFFDYREVEEVSLVKEIIQAVRHKGDKAIKHYTRQYDGVDIEKIKVDNSKIREAYKHVPKELISAIEQSSENIRKFADLQLNQFRDFEAEIVSGVFCGQKVMPIQKVGVYVPGGNFPLLSTLIMCIIPAKVAGVETVSVCSPPTYKGAIHPSILVAADLVGVNNIYQVGGVQAIAAMAYGTETIKRVDKIVGPGNKFVTQAKKDVFGAVGIDFIAGPSEIMIIADETADPDIVAIDLIAQAEHDIDAKPILITTSEELANKVKKAILHHINNLKTKNIAQISIEQNGIAILVDELDEAIAIANKKAPEHLELQVKNPQKIVNLFKNYGSLFIGKNSAEVLGDYSSGLNHTLPTNTTARYSGALGVHNFLKIQNTLNVTAKGLLKIGHIAETLAEAEGLDGHRKSIKIRMEKKDP
jgi:histidinol dehydrogenase